MHSSWACMCIHPACASAFILGVHAHLSCLRTCTHPALARAFILRAQVHTMGQNQVILGHQKFTFPQTREWAKWASERTSARSGGRERSEQSGASERVSGASEWTSVWPSTSVCIIGYSGPQWKGGKGGWHHQERGQVTGTTPGRGRVKTEKRNQRKQGESQEETGL